MISESLLTTKIGSTGSMGSVLSGAPVDNRLIEIDRTVFEADFNRNAFLLKHNLTDSPLFSLPRLIQLAANMPEDLVDYNAGNIPISIEESLTPRTGLSVEETIRRIEECCSWMVMKRIERDPEYKQLLDAFLDEIQQYSEAIEPGMFERAGSVFISSPGSVTPYHMDHETNFLLQIRGKKTVHTFDRWDRTVLPEEDLEQYLSGPTRYRNMVFKDEYEKRERVFTLEPGSVIHIPSTAPHWVKVGPEVSISYSVAFQTQVTDRIRSVRNLNARLRRIGLSPRPYGQSPLSDTLKLYGFRAYRRIMRAVSQDFDAR
jgi:hypothetical protein